MLGSSSSWPIPRLGCDCRQCTSADPRDARLRSSVLLNGRILIDAGPDVYAQLRRADAVPEQVLLTHGHYDHMLGLHDLAKLGRVPLHCTRETEQGLRVIYPRLEFRVFHLHPGVPIELGEDLTASAFDVDHSANQRTVGYRLTGADGEVLVYIPDTGGVPNSKLARGADLLMLDGSTRGRPAKGHLSIEAGIDAARALRAKRTLFTHIGHRTGTHSELEEWLPDGFGVAYDELVIELGA